MKQLNNFSLIISITFYEFYQDLTPISKSLHTEKNINLAYQFPNR